MATSNENSSSYNELWNVLRDPRLITLTIAVLLIVALVVWWGQILLPFIISLVVAYFLEGGIAQLMHKGLRRRWSVLIIFVAFALIYLGAVLGPLQLIVRQTIKLVRNAPQMFDQVRAELESQTGTLLGMFSQSQQTEVVRWVADQLGAWGQQMAQAIVPAFGQATNGAVTLVLVPVLVFFLLIDKEQMITEFRNLLPRDMELVHVIWLEMERKLANYVRGKMWEIIILGVATTIAFLLIGFEYAFLMGFATGLSVLIPYVGMLAVFVPVTLLGLLQWGLTAEFVTLIVAYSVLQFIDGNILAAYIFSEAVKIPPFYILLAVFVFGAIWGFWGVFLAIPLATLAKTIVVTLIEFRGGLIEQSAEQPP